MIRWILDTFFIFTNVSRSRALSRLATSEATGIYHVNKCQSLIISLLAKGKFPKILKSLQVLWRWLLQYCLLLLMFKLPTKFLKNSHVYARTSFVFLKKILKQTWNSLNTNFQHLSETIRKAVTSQRKY